jgi:UDP-N-acetylglucosamine--N-acetylmuramyl-(pentapeptide) pyrophosphoryl-undecaprenol N-acetylglucosamine transferase
LRPAPLIVIAGGGSGGHVFPGLAIAEAMQDNARVDVVFVGTARGLEASVIPASGYRLERLDVVPIKGGGVRRAARGAFFAARAAVRSVALVRRLAPRAVVSVGGYAAGPVTLTAALLGIPVVIVEPNGAAGLANRILGPFAKRAYVAWGPAATSFAPGKTRPFGVPIRRGFHPAPYAPADPPRILVLGGSQGAGPLNERLPEALGVVARSRPGVRVLHQAGKSREDAVRDSYARAGVVGARVVAFLDDVASELSRADVVVARSGAGTVAEIAAVGRPALLVPFPFAADDHQAANALALERAGGAICIRQERADALRLAGELASLLGDAVRLARMSEASRAFGKPHAATDIARDLCQLAGIPWRASLPGPTRSNGSGARVEAV